MIILLDLMSLCKEINGRLQECLHRKQTNRKEAPKMRKVRTRKSSTINPLLMFTAGLEQTVGNQMMHQSKYDDQELRAMARSPKKQVLPISVFSVLAQQLIW